MTRKERENAIRCLKLWIERESQLQTYKTCLEALEQEPSSDAVSREAVDDILCLYSDGNGMIDAEGAVRMVRELSSVKPQEPKTGHWIEPKDFMWENPKCSECGFESADHDNYCPHCGARMVEPQEISDRNLKMWHDIYAEEKRREGSDKE